MTKKTETVEPAHGIPAAQLSKNPTPAQRRAFLRAYDNAGSQSKQDRLHEDNFKNAK